MAGFFPLFFKQYWSAGTEATTSTFWLGVGNSGASFIILLMAPLLGALADSGGIHKRLLAGFALLGIVCTAGFFLVGEGQWQWAIGLYVIAIIGFSGANVFYDAMLPSLTGAEDFHRLSALGYSLGYLGGGLLFLVNVLMTLKPELFGLADAAQAVRYSFLSVALWWFVFMLPLLLGVAEQPGTSTGIAIGLPANSLIIALLLVQFIGFPATLVFGRIGQRYGAKTGLWIGLWAYVIATACAAFMTNSTQFYVLAVVLGLVQGGVQSLSRSLFGQLIPPGKNGEYFGFLNMLGKAAAVLGPLLVGVVAASTGNSRIGLLSILLLFLSGMWFLRKVDDSYFVNNENQS